MDTIDESQPRTAMDTIDEALLKTVTHNIQTGLYKLRLLDTTLQTVFHHFNCIVDENNKIINGLVSCRQCCKLVQFQGSNYKQRLTLHMIVCVPDSVRNDIETKLSSGVYNIHYEVKRGSQFRHTLLARFFARIFTDSSKTIDGYVWCIKCWKLLKEVYLRAHPCYDPKALLAIAKRESALRKSIYIGYYKLSQVSDSLQKSIWKNFAYITLKRRQSVFEIEYGINVECDYIYCRHCQRVLHYPEEDDEELHLYLHNCGVEKDKLFRRNLQSSIKYVAYKKSIENRIRLFRYALKPIKSQRLFINERFAHIILEDNTQLKDMVCCYKCLKVKKYTEPLDIFYLFQHSCCCVQNQDTTGDELIIRAKMEANIRENLKNGNYRTEQLTNQRNAMWKVFAIIKTEDDKTLDDFVYCLKCRELCEFKNNNTCPAHKCLEKYKAKQMARRIAINLKCGKYKLKFVENRKSRMWKVFAVICDEQKPIKNFLYCRQCQQALEVSTGSEKESIAQHECLVNYEVVQGGQGNESKLQKNECDNSEELKGKGSKRLYENDLESIRNYENKRLKVKEKSVPLETNNEFEPGDCEKGTRKEFQEDKTTAPRCYGQRENIKSKNTIGYDAESVNSKNIESPHRTEDNEVVFEKIPGTQEDSSCTYKLWYERKASNKSDDDKRQEENVEKIEIQLEPMENEEASSADISKVVEEIENDNSLNVDEQIPDTSCNSPMIQLEGVSENNEPQDSVLNAINNESGSVNKIIHIKDEPIHLDSNFEFIGRNEEFSVVCCRHCQTLLTYSEANLGYHQCVEAGNAKNSITSLNPERPKCSSASGTAVTTTIASQGNSEEYFVIQELEDTAEVRIKEEIERVTDNEIIDNFGTNSNYEKIGYKENSRDNLQTSKKISNIVDKKLNTNSDITISSEEISSGDEESCESIGDLQNNSDFELNVGEISNSEEETSSESDIDLQNDSDFPKFNNDEEKNNKENCNDYMDVETNNDEENEGKLTDGAEENCRQDENVLRRSDGNSSHNVDENSNDCIELDIKLEKSDDCIEIDNSEDDDDEEKRLDKSSKEKCNSKTKHSAKLSATKSTTEYQLFSSDFENIYHGNYAETEDEIYIEIESD
ncbi:uncharacterized protein LOC101900110 [Musca domestica]|uniref:Uncharacterized protein LOC101900110 n=1 Tax=Musca domestica TaxID=7370 RepID=A0ABM3UY65_MUSDO|nr:uncharacterized protein LOC101900110 [Musca domestica]